MNYLYIFKVAKIQKKYNLRKTIFIELQP